MSRYFSSFNNFLISLETGTNFSINKLTNYHSVVLCGARLRMGVLLAVGSVLMGDTEEWGVYKGNPAKLVKKIDGSKIIDRARVLGYEF